MSKGNTTKSIGDYKEKAGNKIGMNNLQRCEESDVIRSRIRWKVHEFCFRNELPTINSVLAAIIVILTYLILQDKLLTLL